MSPQDTLTAQQPSTILLFHGLLGFGDVSSIALAMSLMMLLASLSICYSSVSTLQSLNPIELLVP